jgi:hypothetical protein
MNNKITSLVMAAGLSTLLTACGGSNGFQAASSVLGQNNSSSVGSGGSSTTTPAAPSAYQQLNYAGQISGGIYDKVQTISLDKTNNALIIALPIPANPMLEVSIEFPQLKGVELKAYQDNNGNSYLAVSIPLSYVLHGVSTIPASALPSGDPLPQMPSGELPSLGLSITNSSVKVHLYIGVNAVGMFIETNFNPYIGLTLPIKNSAGTQVLGYFSMIPQKGTYNGGFFMSAVLPNDVAKIIDDHLNGIIN